MNAATAKKMTENSFRITYFKKVRTGYYVGRANGERFTIEGGKKAGGRKNEWFLDWPCVGEGVPCTSVKDALHVIEHS